MNSTDILIERLNKDISLVKRTDLKTLKDVVAESEVEYYNTSDILNSILDDDVYDYIKEYLRTNSEVNSEIEDDMSHVPDSVGRMHKLPIWMGSTTKVNHGTGQLKNWMRKYSSPWYISAKEDGASALYSNIDGKHKLFSRGKGDEGQNISELLDYLNLPPLEDGEMVRGELMVKKSVFNKKYKSADHFRNSRNSVSGMVNKLGSNASKGVPTILEGLKKEFIHDIEFVAYELIVDPPLKASDQFMELEDIFEPSPGMKGSVARNEIVDNINDDMLSKIYDEYIEVLDYEIDGLVICSNHVYERPYGKNPDYIRAYKKPLAVLTRTTEVISVEWNISKDGLIKPVVIVEPIALDGVTISRATGYNAKNVFDNKIGPGSIVEITRSGGVIPKIINVIEGSDNLTLPKQDFYWNETKVDIYVKYSSDDKFSEERRDANVKQLHSFLVKIGTKGVGPKAVEKMYDEGIRTVVQLLSLSTSDLHFFGDKTAHNIVKTINERKLKLTLPILCGASMVFGRLIGVRRFETIFEKYPNLMEMDCVLDNDVVEIENIIAGINGFARKIAKQVSLGFDEMLDLLDDLKEIGFEPATSLVVKPVINRRREKEEKQDNEEESTSIRSNKPSLEGKNILMTGFRDSSIKDFIISNGGNVQSTLAKKTEILIIKDSSVKNTKVDRALQRGLLILTAEEFKDEYLSSAEEAG